MSDNLPVLKETITAEQKAAFIRALESGRTVRVAAKSANIPAKSTRQLLDLLNDSTVERAINQQMHNEIATTGKRLAWRVAREIMRDKKAPTATRWAAAKWTLEAGGEGIGQTRKITGNSKSLHEMNEDELKQFIASMYATHEKNLIDVTPSPELPEGGAELM